MATKAKKATKAAGASAPAADVPVFVSAVKPDRRERPADVMIEALEKIITEAQAQIYALQHPFQEYPKQVKDRTFASSAEQDAAGPEYAD
jgi:hypothetical protein